MPKLTLFICRALFKNNYAMLGAVFASAFAFELYELHHSTTEIIGALLTPTLGATMLE